MIRNRLAWYAAVAVVLGGISPLFADDLAAGSRYGEWWFYAIAPAVLDRVGGAAGVAVAAVVYAMQFFAAFMVADALVRLPLSLPGWPGSSSSPTR